MKRTTIMLPDELAALLDYERRRRDVPASAVVQEALERYLTPRPDAGREDPRFAFFGAGDSGQTGDFSAVRPRHCRAFRLVP